VFFGDPSNPCDGEIDVEDQVKTHGSSTSEDGQVEEGFGGWQRWRSIWLCWLSALSSLIIPLLSGDMVPIPPHVRSSRMLSPHLRVEQVMSLTCLIFEAETSASSMGLEEHMDLCHQRSAGGRRSRSLNVVFSLPALFM
jgi:hypothetical protein